MKLRVIGESVSARHVAHYLMDGGFTVSDKAASYTIVIKDTQEDLLIVDGIDCDLESHIVRAIALQANVRIVLDRPGPNKSDTEIHIYIPISFSDETRDAVERGIRGGFENKLRAKSNVSLWRKLWG